MFNVLVSWLIVGVAVFLTARLLPGVTIKGAGTSLGVAVVLGLVNAVIRPVVVFLTLPINFITFGLFSLIINAFMVMLVSKIIPGFEIKGFGWAVLFGLVLSVIFSIFTIGLDNLVFLW